MRLGAIGNVLWNATYVTISKAPNDQRYPHIINSGKGAAIIAWQDGRDKDKPYYFDIYAQKVFEDGFLPVELEYFQAFNQTNNISLEWGTASEKNNLGWNIYRSYEGYELFNKINQQLIPGAGNSPIPVDYIYHDYEVKPNNIYTYYLEQIDYDGTTSRSWNIRAILKNNEHQYS